MTQDTDNTPKEELSEIEWFFIEIMCKELFGDDYIIERDTDYKLTG